MNLPTLNLNVLDGLDFGAEPGAGTPLSLALEHVHEDPNQPRKDFDDVLDLAASIAEVGVKVPIAVRPHPIMEGQYIVKFGARRRRAALAAGLTHIPAWLDDVPSDFEQVIENLQRSDLTAMELATFMAEKLSEGLKAAEIARKLGIHRSAVAKYLSLVNAPAAIEAVYRNGRSTSPETLFELRSLYTRFPAETKAWLDSDIDVSRRSVEDLKQRPNSVEALGDVDANASAKPRRPVSPGDPAEIKRPIIAVKAGERFGTLVLNRRANEDGHILVKWHDTAEVSAVSCHDIRLLRIDDARRYEPIHRGLMRRRTGAASSPAKRDPPT